MTRVLHVGKKRRKSSVRKLKPFLLPISLLFLAGALSLYILIFGLPGRAATSPPTEGPVIEKLLPSSGSAGTKIVIKGVGFADAGNNVLLTAQDSMPGYISNLESKDGKTLRFTVPDGLDLCPPNAKDRGIPCPLAYPQVIAGEYQVEVHNSQGESNTVTFTVKD